MSPETKAYITDWSRYGVWALGMYTVLKDLPHFFPFEHRREVLGMIGFFGGALLGFGDFHSSLRGSRRFNRRALLDRGFVKSAIGMGIGTLAARDFAVKLPKD